MRKIKVILAIAGAGLLAVLVARIGPALLVRQLAVLRWCVPVLVVLGLVKLSLRTWSWRQALAADGIAVSTRQLLGVSIASQSMGYLSVMGPLVGEPIKPLLLRNSAAVESSTPSTLADTTVYWLSSALLGLIGTLAAILFAAKGPGAFAVSAISLAVFAGAMLPLLTRRPLVPFISAFMCRWKGDAHRSCSLLRKAGEIEDRMRSFRLRHLRTVLRMFFLGVLVQIATAAEVLAVMTALGVHIGFFALLAVEAANRMVKLLSFYVPGRVGADEGGAAGAFLLFGLDPAAGLTLAIARRAQALIWALVGLAWLSFTSAARQKESYDAGAHFVARA